MFKSYIKIAWRNLWKHKFYSALNIFGLSFGIAGGLVLFQFITYHLSFDRFHKNADNIYRVVTNLHLADGSIINEQGSPLKISASLQKELPAISEAAVLLKVRTMTADVQVASQRKFFKETDNIAFTDEHWFRIFDYMWLEGNAETCLKEPNTVAITKRLAEKYFGSEECLGKIILLDNKIPVKITGVLKNNPANTDIKVEMFISRPTFKYSYPAIEEQMTNEWGYISSTTHSYVLLTGSYSIQRINTVLDNLSKRHFPADMSAAYQFRMQPLKDIHFDGRYTGVIRKSLLVTLAIVGLFLVIIACFNFINLTTAQSVNRTKEIGTRKVLGGTPASIFWQFITETTCIVFVAAVLSFLWIGLTLPQLNDMLQIQLNINLFQDHQLFFFLLLVLAFVIPAGGFYPALILSRFKPTHALKKQTGTAKPAIFRKGLVVVQNVIVQLLIICTIIITLQVKHLKNADLGFDKESVLMIPIPNPDNSKRLFLDQQLKTNPEIKSVSFCLQAPSSTVTIGGSVKYKDHAWEDFNVRSVVGDASYLSTFGLKLIAGTNLQESDTIRQFLVNETLLKKLNIADPNQIIGQQLTAGGFQDHRGTVAGVVKDFNAHALYSPLEPVIITTEHDFYKNVAIKLSGGNHAQSLERIRNAWQNVYPENVFEYHYLDQQLDEFYHKEDLFNKLVNGTTAIAIFISCLGLLGLISFFTVQRSKEIGIRKVLGASVSSIVYMLTKDFVGLLLLSIVIASPIAWYFMSYWLRDFAYRINISWWIFAAAGIGSILIALITVSLQALKAALANPVKSLKAD